MFDFSKPPTILDIIFTGAVVLLVMFFSYKFLKSKAKNKNLVNQN